MRMAECSASQAECGRDATLPPRTECARGLIVCLNSETLRGIAQKEPGKSASCMVRLQIDEQLGEDSAV